MYNKTTWDSRILAKLNNIIMRKDAGQNKVVVAA